MTDLPNPNPVEPAAANPITEPAPVQGTIQPGGEATAQGASVEETFGNVDPKTLPPQLKSVYDNMLKGFKEKTTKLSEERKKYEGYDTYRQKAELYEKFNANPEFVRLWNEHTEKAKQAATNDPGKVALERLKEVEKKLQYAELVKTVEEFSSQKDDKGEVLRPDFNDLNSIAVGKAQDGTDFSFLRACVELADGKTPQEKLEKGYKVAKEIRDRIYEEGRKAEHEKLVGRVRNSTNPPSITSGEHSISGDPKTWTVRQAREHAEKGVVVQ